MKPAVPAAALVPCFLLALGCGEPTGPAPRPGKPLALLLVTLDTTRADALAPEAAGAETPAFAALAARGARFTHAYATAPMTLPAHASMLTGLYPAGHGLHENSRTLAAGPELLAVRLKKAGYSTAAFVSGYPLDRQFGLAAGFDLYDDDLGSANEVRAGETTDRALACLASAPTGPLFLWVHYYDPHDPYEPPEPYRSRYRENPYHGEIAYLDSQLGRLLQAFEARPGPRGVIVVGDHGEGLGDHGEAFHGNLLYQGVMRVPLVVAGTGIPAAVVERPVSARKVFDTLLGWSRGEGAPGLLAPSAEPVLGEAMKPYLQYGWQPQTMALEGRLKLIRSGETEVYDVVADPTESRDLAGQASPSRAALEALREYPLPSTDPPVTAELGPEARARLASLGYVAAESPPKLDPAAPSPRRMVHLFADLDRASGLFLAERWAEVIPLLGRLAAADPGNLSLALRLAAAHSALGRDAEALAAFKKAAAIDPESPDLQHYLGLHHLRQNRLEASALRLERALAANPRRLQTLEALAQIRERQGRLPEAVSFLEQVALLETHPETTLLHLGDLAMATESTEAAIGAFERAREVQGASFSRHLELGVCYLAARRLPEAAASLDRVPASHPAYPMALFKRAQVAVLLGEPDRDERLRRAREHADEVTRGLIEREKLFREGPSP